MVLGALAALLEIEHDISVVGQALNGKVALQLTLAHKPDLLLTDIEMPEMSGLEVAAELKRQVASSRVIILTTFARVTQSLRSAKIRWPTISKALQVSPPSLRRVHMSGRSRSSVLRTAGVRVRRAMVSSRSCCMVRVPGNGL